MTQPMQCAVILPAAGLGRRYRAGLAAAHAQGAGKLETVLAGKAVFLHAMEAFVGHPGVAQILLAVGPEDFSQFEFRWKDRLALLGVDLVAGGRRERWETVALASAAVRPGITHVAVHDAARPLLRRELVARVLAAAQHYSAVVPALPVSSTLKRIPAGAALKLAEEASEITPPVDSLADLLGFKRAAASEHGHEEACPQPVVPVVATVPRTDLCEAQTPQVFERGLFDRACQAILKGEIDPQGITDDASLVEALGEPVYLVAGDPINLKLTRSGDALLMTAWLEQQRKAEAISAATRRLWPDEDGG